MAWWNDAISGFSNGIGGVIAKSVGKVLDFIPGREESLRNQESDLVRKRDELENTKPKPADFEQRYKSIITKLHLIRERLKNR